MQYPPAHGEQFQAEGTFLGRRRGHRLASRGGAQARLRCRGRGALPCPAGRCSRQGVPVHLGVLPSPAIRGPYDIVSAIDVIEHVDKPLDLLIEIRDLLAADGIGVLVTPDIGSITARLMRRKWWHFGRRISATSTAIRFACRLSALDFCPSPSRVRHGICRWTTSPAGSRATCLLATRSLCRNCSAVSRSRSIYTTRRWLCSAGPTRKVTDVAKLDRRDDTSATEWTWQ